MGEIQAGLLLALESEVALYQLLRSEQTGPENQLKHVTVNNGAHKLVEIIHYKSLRTPFALGARTRCLWGNYPLSDVAISEFESIPRT